MWDSPFLKPTADDHAKAAAMLSDEQLEERATQAERNRDESEGDLMRTMFDRQAQGYRQALAERAAAPKVYRATDLLEPWEVAILRGSEHPANAASL